MPHNTNSDSNFNARKWDAKIITNKRATNHANGINNLANDDRSIISSEIIFGWVFSFRLSICVLSLLFFCVTSLAAVGKLLLELVWFHFALFSIHTHLSIASQFLYTCVNFCRIFFLSNIIVFLLFFLLHSKLQQFTTWTPLDSPQINKQIKYICMQ